MRYEARSVVKKIVLLSAVLSLAGAAGCMKREKMANAKATADIKASEYDKALASWSRTEKAYQELETRLLVSATYRSAAFRDAYVDEYARRYLLPDGERDSMKVREHDAAGDYHEFFFAAYTVESRWNDFSRRNSMWRVRLFDDKGGSAEPLVVTKVKQDDPVLHAFFPYFTIWSRGYTVKFPRAGIAEDSKTLRLQLSSAIGATEMTFNREGADTKPPVRVEAGGNTATAPVP